MNKGSAFFFAAGFSALKSYVKKHWTTSSCNKLFITWRLKIHSFCSRHFSCTWRCLFHQRKLMTFSPPSRAWRPAPRLPAGWWTRAACPSPPIRGGAAEERLAPPASPRWTGRPAWSCSGSGRRRRCLRVALRSWRPRSPWAILCTTACLPAAAKDDAARSVARGGVASGRLSSPENVTMSSARRKKEPGEGFLGLLQLERRIDLLFSGFPTKTRSQKPPNKIGSSLFHRRWTLGFMSTLKTHGELWISTRGRRPRSELFLVFSFW